MKIRKRYLFPTLLAGAFLAGPRPGFPPLDGKLKPVNLPLEQLDSFVHQKDVGIAHLRPGNGGSIIWADSLRKTPYSVVYLHGWSASPVEGDPIHREFAKRYGCNLYLPRLAGHGIDSKESFADLTPNELLESAKEAVEIGQLLGEKVILMSCSTGGTLSVYLTAENPDAVFAQLLFSPNIDIYDPLSELLTIPWGKQIAEQVNGKYHSFSPPEEGFKYWTTTYRTSGLVCLKSLIERTMKPEVWHKIRQPLFMGYYYKNEEEQDKVVSVKEMLRFFDNVSTPEGQKVKMAFPNAGHHVVVSRINSRDLESVRRETIAYAENVLGLKPVAGE
ncbi:MAG: alpha/beta hydrolase [Saprospiraceae bacterium]